MKLNKSYILLLAGSLFLLGLSMPAQSASIAITNADFSQIWYSATDSTLITMSGANLSNVAGIDRSDAQVFGPNSRNSAGAGAYVPGWHTSATSIWNAGVGYYTVTNTSGISVNMNIAKWGAGALPNVLTQALGANLEASQTYTLSFDTVWRPSTTDNPFAAPVVKLLAGSTALTLSSSDTPIPSVANQLVTWTYTFNSADAANIALIGQTLNIKVDATTTGLDWSKTNISYMTNLSLTAVPEPSSWALLMLGFSTLLFGGNIARKSKTA